MSTPPTPPSPKGRGLETLYHRAIEHQSVFGMEIIDAITQKGISFTEVAKQIGTSDTTLRRMVLRQNTNATPQDSIHRLFKIKEVLGIPLPRLFGLFFFNSGEQELAHILYLHQVYQMLTPEDRVFWEAMIHGLLKARGYTPPQQEKGATLNENDTLNETTRKED